MHDKILFLNCPMLFFFFFFFFFFFIIIFVFIFFCVLFTKKNMNCVSLLLPVICPGARRVAARRFAG